MLFIYSIDVIKDYRKQGIGTQLMEQVIQYGKDHQCYKAFVITNRSNKNACLLYEKVNGI